MRSRFLLLLLVLCLGFSVANTTKAISVGPGLVDVTVDAGKQTDFSILVTNEEAQTLSFALTIQKFIPQGDSGQVEFLSPNDTSGLPDWLFLEAPTLTLRSGESRNVSVSLRVPNDATPGGHYAAVFLTQTSLDTSAGQNVSAIPRIGVLVFATVNGNVVEKVALREARVEQISGSHLPARFIVTVENNGNVHVLPSVRIDITNVFRQTVASLDGNTVDSRVLPGSARVFTSDWIKGSGVSDGGFWNELKQEWSNGAIGWYEARIRVSSRVGDSGETLVRFQVWPWRSLSIGFGLILLLTFAYIGMRRSKPRLYSR
ncbi:hypothetical protein K8R04_04120 [Candidatus Uhrbacteria bacterium]|nr:hypothetical protein [Candidatus Uhrbacteria bacterium]